MEGTEKIVRVEDFQRDVVERSRATPVVVDFWAEWCAPCRVLGPVLERLAGEADGAWVLATLDTERHPRVAADWGIRSIPHVKLFVDGAAVDEFTGALPEYAIRSWLKAAIPSPSAGAFAEARGLLLRGEEGAAAAMLEPIVRDDPADAEARVLLARSVVREDRARALSLIEGLEEPRLSDDIDTVRTAARLMEIAGGGPCSAEQDREETPSARAYAAAARSFAAGEYDAALEGFIRVIREDRYHDDDGSRKACLAIFRILGEEHEVTRRHRREFGSALYV